MVNKNLVIDTKEFKYKGIFKTDELFTTINKAIKDRGYVAAEKKNEETVSESGRNIYLELRPTKLKYVWIQLLLKVKINLTNITETVEELNGVMQNFQSGDVVVSFDAWLNTYNENRWEMRPWFFFMKGIVHKFLYRLPSESEPINELIGDTAYIFAKVRTLFNSYKPAADKPLSEQEIIRKTEEDMQREIQQQDASWSETE